VVSVTDPYGRILGFLWSSGQSSWLQIRRPGVRFPALPEKKVVGLERGPLSLVSTTEELLDRKVAAPVLSFIIIYELIHKVSKVKLSQ
jgi:hypothetical protein